MVRVCLINTKYQFTLTSILFLHSTKWCVWYNVKKMHLHSLMRQSWVCCIVLFMRPVFFLLHQITMTHITGNFQGLVQGLWDTETRWNCSLQNKTCKPPLLRWNGANTIVENICTLSQFCIISIEKITRIKGVHTVPSTTFYIVKLIPCFIPRGNLEMYGVMHN